MKHLNEVARMQQLAGLTEGISKRTSGLRALQEGDDTQEIFNDWIDGQREVQNDIDAEFPEELRGDDEISWKEFLELITKYPNADREDVSSAVSAVMFADIPFEGISWNDEQTARDVYEDLENR